MHERPRTLIFRAGADHRLDFYARSDSRSRTSGPLLDIGFRPTILLLRHVGFCLALAVPYADQKRGKDLTAPILRRYSSSSVTIDATLTGSEAGPAYQESVDIRLRLEPLRIFRFDAAAV